MENVYLGKKLLQDKEIPSKDNKKEEEDEDHSYSQLISDYRSGTTHSEEEQESSSSVDVLSQECSVTHDAIPDLLQQDVCMWKSLDTSDLVENAQKLLESVNRTLLKSETIAGLSEHSEVFNRSTDIASDSTLLESVSKTLPSVVTISGRSEDKNDVFHSEENFRLGKPRKPLGSMNKAISGHSGEENEVFHSNNVIEKESQLLNRTSLNSEQVANQSEQSIRGKPMVRCKSEDTSVRRRRLSSGRRRSVTAHNRTSSERRYSSDVSTYMLLLERGRGINLFASFSPSSSSSSSSSSFFFFLLFFLFFFLFSSFSSSFFSSSYFLLFLLFSSFSSYSTSSSFLLFLLFIFFFFLCLFFFFLCLFFLFFFFFFPPQPLAPWITGFLIYRLRKKSQPVLFVFCPSFSLRDVLYDSTDLSWS